MKKLLALLGMTVLLFSIPGCKKEILDPGTIVYTDDPPKELFSSTQTYGQSWKGFLEQEQITKATSRGILCWFNQNAQPYDCDKWYSIPARKYWGLYQGKIYVSKSQDWYVIQGSIFLDAEDAIQRKKAAIGYLCIGCQNPAGGTSIIGGIEQ